VVNIENNQEAEQFLQGLGLHVGENVVHQVIDVLSGKIQKSLYSLYRNVKGKPLPICAKGTAYKIKKLYEKGKLIQYLNYISNSPITDNTMQKKAPYEEEIVSIPGDFAKLQLTKHLNELEKTAKILVHQCQRLLRYKDKTNVEARGYIITKLSFWDRQNREFMVEGASSEDYAESKYEDENPVDKYLAGLLYIHYQEQFGQAPFSAWNQLSIINISPEIVEKMNILAHDGLKQCKGCPICSKIVG
jgi:hypothetical protein